MHLYIPVFSNCLVFGNTDVLTLLFLDGAWYFPCSLDTLLVTSLLHLEISDKGNDVMANILTGFLVGTKFNWLWLPTISF